MGLSAFELEAVVKQGANVILEDGGIPVAILEQILKLALETNATVTINSENFSSLELEKLAIAGGNKLTIISR